MNGEEMRIKKTPKRNEMESGKEELPLADEGGPEKERGAASLRKTESFLSYSPKKNVGEKVSSTEEEERRRAAPLPEQGGEIFEGSSTVFVEGPAASNPRRG